MQPLPGHPRSVWAGSLHPENTERWVGTISALQGMGDRPGSWERLWLAASRGSVSTEPAIQPHPHCTESLTVLSLEGSRFMLAGIHSELGQMFSDISAITMYYYVIYQLPGPRTPCVQSIPSHPVSRTPAPAKSCHAQECHTVGILQPEAFQIGSLDSVHLRLP